MRKPHIYKNADGWWCFKKTPRYGYTLEEHILNKVATAFTERLTNEIRYASYRRMVALSEATSSGVQSEV